MSKKSKNPQLNRGQSRQYPIKSSKKSRPGRGSTRKVVEKVEEVVDKVDEVIEKVEEPVVESPVEAVPEKVVEKAEEVVDKVEEPAVDAKVVEGRIADLGPDLARSQLLEKIRRLEETREGPDLGLGPGPGLEAAQGPVAGPF